MKKNIQYLITLILFINLSVNAQNKATTSGNWNNCATWGNPTSIIQNVTDTKTINTGVNVIQNTTWSTKTIDFTTGNGSISFASSANSIDFVTDLGPDQSCCSVPAITANPVSGTTDGVTNYSFSVVATGTGLTYQWRRDGVNIPGATGSSYSTNITATYSAVITGNCGSITSANAMLTNPCTTGTISTYTATGSYVFNANNNGNNNVTTHYGTNTTAVSWSAANGFTINCAGTYTVEGDVVMNITNPGPAGTPTSLRLSGMGEMAEGTQHFTVTKYMTVGENHYFWSYVSLGQGMSFTISNGKITKIN